MIARAVVLTTNICSELELKAHVPFAWRFFTNKKRLIKYYKSAFFYLAIKNDEWELFLFLLLMFSHMTLSVAFWHYDLHWKVWSKEGMDFERHPNCSPNPFIILSDFEVGNSNISRLRDIFEGWEALGSTDESDDDELFHSRINEHEIAEAPGYKALIPTFFGTKKVNSTSNIDDALFNERVRVRDEEGHVDINFLDLIQQRSQQTV
ncbi:hypothetical protein CYQ91_23430 [Vibrio diabolicus]|uniref:Uncharacterized protein n=1 Tax=Vibrio diabolicus TaxID=50719 RepID=A0AAX1XGC6_9VIBR|nr:hypothetical protein [Vibrio diabolicus]RPB32630.1 hypothetical protein CYQ91_23430 [Vibrio diabolicus]